MNTIFDAVVNQSFVRSKNLDILPLKPMSKRIILSLLFSGFFFILFNASCTKAKHEIQPVVPVVTTPVTPPILTKTYHVAKTGDDRNQGTLLSPFLTIQKASEVVSPGDTIYIRAGIYQEIVNFTRSGTGNYNIHILSFPSETPVIDGNNCTIPTEDYSSLVTISGDYIEMNGVEIRFSHGMGLLLCGRYDKALSIYSHHNTQNGILITGDNGLVQNSTVYSNCMSNFGGTAGMNASGLSAARNPNSAVIKDNLVYENWGEGLSTFEANGTLIEGNTVYDNWAANIYISDATNVTLKQNFVYQTKDMSPGSQVGILLGDETYNPPSANLQIFNNIVYGCNRNLYWYQGTKGGGMNHVDIANNTFVNSKYVSAVEFNRGPHSGVTFKNNIVVQNGGLTPIVALKDQQLKFSNNLWSARPYTAASGSGDVIGDPRFTDNVQPFVAISYKLTGSSPAINSGVNIGLNTDYLGNKIEGLPDIGAIEYISGQTH